MPFALQNKQNNNHETFNYYSTHSINILLK